jgi:hypothetical protein
MKKSFLHKIQTAPRGFLQGKKSLEKSPFEEVNIRIDFLIPFSLKSFLCTKIDFEKTHGMS